MSPRLVVMSGLPGVGKTTIARALARALPAMLVRADTIEQAIRESHLGGRNIADAGYRVGYAVAAENLRLGHHVVADSVNPLAITRDAWRDAGLRVGATVVEVEIVCSDPVEHRRRVESRTPDPPTLRQPTWQDVLDRRVEPWSRESFRFDSATMTVDAIVAAIVGAD